MAHMPMAQPYKILLTFTSMAATFPLKQARTSDVSNLLTGETLYKCAAAGTGDYEPAIQKAHTAFKSWSLTTPSARRLILFRAADILQSYLERDAPEILSNEVSATASWVKVNINVTAGILRESAGLATHIKGEVVPYHSGVQAGIRGSLDRAGSAWN